MSTLRPWILSEEMPALFLTRHPAKLGISLWAITQSSVRHNGHRLYGWADGPHPRHSICRPAPFPEWPELTGLAGQSCQPPCTGQLTSGICSSLAGPALGLQLSQSGQLVSGICSSPAVKSLSTAACPSPTRDSFVQLKVQQGPAGRDRELLRKLYSE